MALSTPFSFSRRYAILRCAIWLYCILIIIEGALRKWIFPSLSNPLLIIRDPVVLCIYGLSLSKGCFPKNGFVLGALALALFSFLFGILSEHSSVWITLYGLRVNYLHLPLMFVVPAVMTRSDVEALGKLFLWICLPMTVLEVLQFYAPPEHWLNANPSKAEGLTLTGGLGRLRSSGTFSFTQGLGAYFVFVTAFFLSVLIEQKKASKVFLIAVGVSLLVAIPFSVSRSLALGCGIVLLGATFSMYFKKSTSQVVFRTLCILTVVVCAAAYLPFFDDGVASFGDRWVSATGTTRDDFQVSIIDRFTEGFTQAYQFINYAGLTGIGVGMGTNVATKLLNNQLGFLLAENEWSRIILELGSILGLAFIGLRIGLFYFLLKQAYIQLRLGNVLPFILLSACGLLILNGQWAPPTNLGFATLGGGLVLAACNPWHETALQKAKRRYYALRVLNAHEPRQTPLRAKGSYTL